jgi:hypothetical protein
LDLGFLGVIRHRRTSSRRSYIGSKLEELHRTECAFDGTERRPEKHDVSLENAPHRLATEPAGVQTQLKRRFEMDLPWFDRHAELRG